MNEREGQFDEFEQRLTEAMRPVDAPAGFVERTMARAQSKPHVQARVVMMRRRNAWAVGTIAAALLFGVVLGEHEHVRRQQERAAAAQQQFEAAMRITDRTLQHTREQLQRAGIELGN